MPLTLGENEEKCPVCHGEGQLEGFGGGGRTQCFKCKGFGKVSKATDNNRAIKTERGSSSELACSEWIECAAKSCERTASHYAEISNNTSGVSHMICGEICDALRHLADELRAGAEAHSIDQDQRRLPESE